MTTMIVAYNEKRTIGDGSSIPWRIPEDLKFFKDTTMGSACIMGRKTWESIPAKFRPLVGRLNVVITSNPEKIQKTDQVVAFDSVEKALDYCEYDKVFICGGGQIYRYCLDNRLTGIVIASEIKGSDAEGIKFPELKGWDRKVLKEYEKFDVVEYRDGKY